jgi:hypothetical protein
MIKDKYIWEIKTTIIRRTIMWLSIGGLIVLGIIPLILALIFDSRKIGDHFTVYYKVIDNSIRSMWNGEPHTPFSAIVKQVENK